MNGPEKMSKPRLLLHVCCAPCSTHVIEKLKEDYELGCFFYGPNIHPEEEYEKRLKESRGYCANQGIEFLEGNYDKEDWLQAVKGHENDVEGGDRCRICYRYRLLRTAETAKNEGYDLFTSTLTVSPHKDAAIINEIGEEIGRSTDIIFLSENFKKEHGYQISVQMSRDRGLYRQDYCGCVFSQR
ncbi:MAG: epoxyqueuosine reductase QueH [Thermoplasmata archaeon]|nr:epoxyqueuosine reductase QueH [Thermoplasmata archaeon]